MKGLVRWGLGALSVVMTAGLAQADDDGMEGLALTVLWPQTEQTREAFLQVKNAGLAEAVVKMAEQRMMLKGSVALILGGGGAPRVNTESQAVVMPYEHLQNIQKDLSASQGFDVTDLQPALDAFTYSLIHQLSHIVITQQGGSGQWLGEDAVADLTMLTLLEHMPDGGRIARNALSLFDRQGVGMATRSKNNYWSSHLLNAERYQSGVCQLLGSGYSVGADMLTEQMSDEKCSKHYAALRNSWGQVFAQGIEPVKRSTNLASR